MLQLCDKTVVTSDTLHFVLICQCIHVFSTVHHSDRGVGIVVTYYGTVGVSAPNLTVARDYGLL